MKTNCNSATDLYIYNLLGTTVYVSLVTHVSPYCAFPYIRRSSQWRVEHLGIVNRNNLPCAQWVGRKSLHSTFCCVRWFHNRQTCAHRQMSWTDNRLKMFSRSSLGKHSTVFSVLGEAPVSTASVTRCSSSSDSDATDNHQNIHISNFMLAYSSIIKCSNHTRNNSLIIEMFDQNAQINSTLAFNTALALDTHSPSPTNHAVIIFIL